MYYERLKEARKKAKLTQKFVADQLGIPDTQLIRYEKGINELPLRYFREMCRIYQVSADDILELKD